MSLILPLKRESDGGDEDIQPRICDIRSEATSTSMESTDDSRVFETFLSQLCNAELTSLNNSRNLQEELIVPHSVSYSSGSSDLLPDDETLIVKELMSMIYNVIAKKSKIKKYVSDTNSVRFQIENAQNKSVVILHCAKLNVTSSKNLNDITTNNSNTTTTTTTSTNSSNINNNSNSNNNNCEIDTLRTIIKQEPSDSNYILPDGYIPVTEVTSSSPSFDERYLAASHSNESPSKVDPTNESLPVEQFEIDMQQNQSHVEESASQVHGIMATIREPTSECGPRKKKSRKVLSLHEKMIILEKIANGRTYASLSKEYGCNESSIRTIKKCENKIKTSIKMVTNPMIAKSTFVSGRNPLIEKMEKLLNLWIEDQQNKKLPLTGNIIRSKALSIYKRIKAQDPNAHVDGSTFGATRGWFHRFRKRANLHTI